MSGVLVCTYTVIKPAFLQICKKQELSESAGIKKIQPLCQKYPNEVYIYLMNLRERNVIAFVTYDSATFDWDSLFVALQKLNAKRSEKFYKVSLSTFNKSCSLIDSDRISDVWLILNYIC